MCGIAGIVGFNANDHNIQNMINAMLHRGPDGKGIYLNENIALGHTRLSILDLSPLGAQPMSTDDGRYTIVYNGEIYNHRELRTQFFKNEHFKSESDTETILKLYQRFGREILVHLRGMFSFVIYDAIENKIFGARDRMGIKPFLYTIKNNHFIFGSELKAILASNLIPRDIEENALRQLMLYGSVQFPYTFIKDIFSLPPATSFTYANGVMKILPYWDFPSEVDTTITFDEASEKFKNLYEESIELELLSDRPVGLFLSSGLDSVTMLAALKKTGNKKIKSFTIGFSDKHEKFYSEVEKAKGISNYLEFENNSKIINGELLTNDINHFIKVLDQPSIDGFNTFIVSAEAKSFLTVALSGLGGDELLMGYPRNINLYNKYNSIIKIPSIYADRMLINDLYSGKNGSKITSRIQKYFGNPKNLKLHYWASRLINKPSYINNKLLNPEFSKNPEEDFEDFYRFNTGYDSNMFNQISYYEMRTYMLSQLLRDMDVLSMANGIEVRFPLLDHKLIEFIFSLPPQYKFANLNNSKNNSTGKFTYAESGMKYIMGKAYENMLPEGYLKTPKQGFQLPINTWFKNAQKGNLEDILGSDLLVNYGFEKKELSKIRTTLQNEKFDSNHYLLLMISSCLNNLRN
jgi:asparagine synthase (glutamine-hydrolysing)